MELNFLSGHKVRMVKAAQSSAGTDVDSSVVDMQGFLDATFFVTIATANAANFLKLQQGDESDGSDMADLEGTKVVAAADGDVVCAEVFRPLKRYVRAVVDRGGADTATGDMYCVQSQARVVPVDNNEAGEIVSEIHATPAEGTA